MLMKAALTAALLMACFACDGTTTNGPVGADEVGVPAGDGLGTQNGSGGEEAGVPAAEAVENIGTATMQADGTIVLRLRAVSGPAIGEGILTYPPSHPEYEAILRHAGPLGAGETVPVRPWPDER